MSKKSKGRFPCRYVVVKYIEDEIRDEAVNLGVIVQDMETNLAWCMFVDDDFIDNMNVDTAQDLMHNVKGTADIVKQRFKQIREQTMKPDGDHRVVAPDYLDKLHHRGLYGGRLHYTEPRATLPEEFEEPDSRGRAIRGEVIDLFEKYVSITHWS